jgi:hypothetical protein
VVVPVSVWFRSLFAARPNVAAIENDLAPSPVRV